MNKIRLTEAQLHRVIKESVEKVLNEIKFGGESLHGDNPEDWTAMEKLRDMKVDNAPFYANTSHSSREGWQDGENADELYRKRTLKRNPNIHDIDFNKGWQDMRSKGGAKAVRMYDNLTKH